MKTFDNSEIDIDKVEFKMLAIKVLTLNLHLPEGEVEKYFGCEFEFDLDRETDLPFRLQTWVGEDHIRTDENHEVFDIPEELRFPII